MIGLDAFRGHFPPFPFITPITMAHVSLVRGYETYERIERLHELVNLNIGTFVQYQTWQYRIVNDMLEARKPTSISSEGASPIELSEDITPESKNAAEMNEEGTKEAPFDPFSVHELGYQHRSLSIVSINSLQRNCYLTSIKNSTGSLCYIKD